MLVNVCNLIGSVFWQLNITNKLGKDQSMPASLVGVHYYLSFLLGLKKNQSKIVPIFSNNDCQCAKY